VLPARNALGRPLYFRTECHYAPGTDRSGTHPSVYCEA